MARRGSQKGGGRGEGGRGDGGPTGSRTVAPRRDRAASELEAREAPTQADVSSSARLARKGRASSTTLGSHVLSTSPAPVRRHIRSSSRACRVPSTDLRNRSSKKCASSSEAMILTKPENQ